MEKARRATGLVADLGGELARCAPDTVAAALDEALRRVDALSDRHDEVADALRLVTAQLKVYGTEGRKCQLDAAETEREHAEAEYLRVHRRARAAQLLRSVMARHRDATRLRYVDPFRNQVERLGRIVFGDTFEVEIDSQLRICSRTLSGRTVPYESLSGGAKEQLGIVARLAGAALVAKEDSVPVVIDDALGFTDPDRLIKMGAVFDAVGGDGQVIVLTCSPQRYESVGAAHHIELSAPRRRPPSRGRRSAEMRCAWRRSHRDRRSNFTRRSAALRSAAVEPTRAVIRSAAVAVTVTAALDSRSGEISVPYREFETATVDVDPVGVVQVRGAGRIEGQQDAGEKAVQRRERTGVRFDQIQSECGDGLNDRRHLAPPRLAERVHGAGDRWR